MANRFGRKVAKPAAFNPQGLLPEGLLPVARPSGEHREAQAQASQQVATAFGRLADELAVVDGERAGRTAGLDPNFRPLGLPTLRARAYDAAATQVYAYGLNSKMRVRLDEVYEANKESPTKLREAFNKLSTELEGDLFPEIAGKFRTDFARLRYGYERRAGQALEARVRAQARQSFSENLAARKFSLERALYGAGLNENGAHALTGEVSDFQSFIEGAVTAGHMTRSEGARELATATDAATVATVLGEFDQLPDLEAREQFMQRIDQHFVAGEGRFAEIAPRTMQRLRSELATRLRREIDAEDKGRRETAKQASADAAIEGEQRLRDGTLDNAWLDNSAEVLGPATYRNLTRMLNGTGPSRTDPAIYSDLLERAPLEPAWVQREAREHFVAGALDRTSYDRVQSAIAAARREERPFVSDLRRDIARRLRPSDRQDPDEAQRQQDAGFAFDEWMEANPRATRDEAREKADALVEEYRGAAVANERAALTLPRYVTAGRDAVTMADLASAWERMRRAREQGLLAEENYRTEAELLLRWRDLLQRQPARRAR